jgi:hypothetical protein
VSPNHDLLEHGSENLGMVAPGQVGERVPRGLFGTMHPMGDNRQAARVDLVDWDEKSRCIRHEFASATAQCTRVKNDVGQVHEGVAVEYAQNADVSLNL